MAEFKSLTLNDNTLSSAKVTEWIAQAHAYINGRVCCKVSVPVASGASPNSFAILKNIETYLVCHRIQAQLRIDTGSDSVEDQPSRGFKKEAMTMIQEIIKGELKLQDATPASSADGHRSHMVDDDLSAVFDYETVQW